MTAKKKFVVDAVTRQRQTIASNPKNTVWVSANAGSGKTHVLSERVIRLLLEGVEPSKILCLTYTKTAAAEMINRVFERLSAWVALNDAALSEAMVDIEERKADAARLRMARTLFARALETPGGLQIQTIHAFCTTILKRFPLEANIAGHFELLDDDTDALFRQEAKRRVTVEAYHGGNRELSDAFELALDKGGEGALEALLDAALSGPERGALQTFLKMRKDGRVAADFLDQFAGLSEGQGRAEILANSWPLASLSIGRMQDVVNAGPYRTETMTKFAQGLYDAMNEHNPEDRFELLASLFLTKEGSARKPGLYQNYVSEFEAAAQEILEITDRIARREMVELSKAAHVLLDRLTTIHTGMKRDGGFLDYEDLIEATQRLLQRDLASAWVQYKLDQGIDHVLVDEAQDTSQRQWSIINTLTSDFFTGESAARKERTLFVVGDEKQSIYSFQGARPEVFAQTGRNKAVLLDQVRRPFAKVNFSLSFRSTPEILAAVDHVFEGGLSGDGEAIIHQSIRQKQHGQVEVWETIVGEKSEEVDDWKHAVDHASAPTVKLAVDVAKTIESLVGKATNPATGKLIRPGDILVLVRKRDKFMHALSKELKDRQVAVAGADRLVLTSHIAILDLMAAANVTLQPDDDLSLAALLRSPIFGLSDDELTALASERNGAVSLMARLREQAEGNAALGGIVRQLDGWRNVAGSQPVYEFFAHILGRDGAQAKLIARLGEEALDIIDEFLSYALVCERSGLSGLQAFVETLSRSAPEIKREAGGERNEVRIMTVHGAKGLEAPYVFLVDPGSPPVSSRHQAPLIAIPMPMGNQTFQNFVWSPKKKFANTAIEAELAEQSDRQLAEYKRLLYVGMTRAEDVLIVCSYRGQRPVSEPTWCDIVRKGLIGKTGTSEIVHPVTQRPGLVFRLGESVLEASEDKGQAEARVDAPPHWLFEKLAPYKLPPRPLTPSGLGFSIDVQAESLKGSPVLARADDGMRPALERGSAVHRLLEVLPNFSKGEREAAARRYLERRLPDEAHDPLIARILALLDHKDFELVFSKESRAEVTIGGTLNFGGEARSVSGKIDRLAVTDSHVLIVDYKTNRPAPKHLDEVPTSHIAQLALYRAILLPLYPGKVIEAALIYTEGPHYIALDGGKLASALEALTAS